MVGKQGDPGAVGAGREIKAREQSRKGGVKEAEVGLQADEPFCIMSRSQRYVLRVGS